VSFGEEKWFEQIQFPKMIDKEQIHQLMNKSSSNDEHFNKELDQILLTEGVIKSSCEEADDSNKI
jgi:hypothetical protein